MDSSIVLGLARLAGALVEGRLTSPAGDGGKMRGKDMQGTEVLQRRLKCSSGMGVESMFAHTKREIKMLDRDNKTRKRKKD